MTAIKKYRRRDGGLRLAATAAVVAALERPSLAGDKSAINTKNLARKEISGYSGKKYRRAPPILPFAWVAGIVGV